MDGELCLGCRIANEPLNQIVNAEVTMTLIPSEKTAEGAVYRNFYDLKLERSRSVFFSLSWTLVHPITPESPLHGLTADQLREAEAEIMVSLSGLDEALSSTIHARHSYIADEMIWGERFVDILNRSEAGMVSVDLPRFHDVEI